jgi:acetate---CoA ligase (ADP-forming)
MKNQKKSDIADNSSAVDINHKLLAEQLEHLFRPQSVAVIGASNSQGTIGHKVMQCLMQAGYTGVVYPINPSADSVLSVKAYPSVQAVPGPVEMAVIVVAARFSLQVVEECGRKGVKALVVISDGFKETGAQGAELENKLLAVARSYGMRLLGPNCIGLINPQKKYSLNASFCPIYPQDGVLAIISQSGALGLTILEYVPSIDIGVSYFVSVGNSADLKVTDFLKYIEKDRRSKVIMLYLESFDKPADFTEIARKVALKKPIIAIKSGSTHTGKKAASSHTGAMAGKEVAVDALLHQTGIVRVQTFQELLGTSLLFASQPMPQGRRMAVLTQAGGAATLSADASELRGLQLPGFSDATKNKIKSAVSRSLNLNNPFDLTGGAGTEEFARVAEILAEDPDFDILLCMWGPVVVIDQTGVSKIIKRISKICRRNRKMLVGCFMISDHVERTKVGKSLRIPIFEYPESAIAAISRACEYVDSMERIENSTVPDFPDIQRSRSLQIIESARAKRSESSFWLSPEEIKDLLNCYGVKQAAAVIARTAAEAAKLASKVGFPLAVKLYSSSITHKSDVGGVILDLKTSKEVEQAFSDIRGKLESKGRAHEMEGVILQPMVKSGIEAIVGMTQDAMGPLIMFGLGGIYTELLKDTVFRLYPLTDRDAAEMVHSLKTALIFDGFRGLKPSDTKSVEELLLRISRLIGDHPEIAELDLNPVKVFSYGEGYSVVDARILIK